MTKSDFEVKVPGKKQEGSKDGQSSLAGVQPMIKGAGNISE